MIGSCDGINTIPSDHYHALSRHSTEFPSFHASFLTGSARFTVKIEDEAGAHKRQLHAVSVTDNEMALPISVPIYLSTYTNAYPRHGKNVNPF